MRVVLVDETSSRRPARNETTFALNSWDDNGSDQRSLPRLVEHHGDELQEAIVTWLQGLKQVLFSAVSRELPDVDPCYSEMHPIFEGNYATTPEHYLLAQLIAFCREAERLNVTAIHYLGVNPDVKSCLAEWCANRNLTFHSASRLQFRLQPLRTLASRWRRIFSLWRSTGSQPSTPWIQQGKVTRLFVDYLVNDPIRTYWAGLERISALMSESTLFIHQFTPHHAIPTLARAREHISVLQSQGVTPARVLLDDWIGRHDLSRVRTNVRAFRNIGHLARRIDPPSVVYMAGLRPLTLYSRQWRAGWRNGAAVDTATKIVAFENIMATTPNLKQAVFLLENQIWEKALLHATTTFRCESIGVPHTVVRPRDLRYLLLTQDSLHQECHVPTKIATGGAATQMVLESRISQMGLVPTEAPRYQSLRRASKNMPRVPSSVLITGDYITKHSKFLLETALPVLSEFNIDVIFKPHPADSGSHLLAEQSGIRITHESLHQVLPSISFLIVGSLTAASAEAVHLGIPVITVVDPRFFNLSPLLRLPFARFARDKHELTSHIQYLLSTDTSEQFEMYTIDESLSRWRSLLSVE